MDQSLWQTFSTIDLIHSAHMWIQTTLSRGKHRTTMQIRIVSGFWFCRRSWRLKVNIRCTLAHFRKSHFRAISWMCKEQTSVSHSSTKAEIISLAAGLRMDGIPALDLLDLVREVFQCSPNQLNNTKGQVQGNLSSNTTSNKHTQNKTKVPPQHDNFDLNNVDCVPSNAKFSRFGAVLYICGAVHLLRITKPWSKWSSKAEVQQWDMYPERTELLLIGCLTELIGTTKIKSSMSTPNTSLQT